MPYNSQNTIIIEGHPIGLANAMYKNYLTYHQRRSPDIPQTTEAEYLIIWNTEQKLRTYDLMSEFNERLQRSGYVNAWVQGGIKMDLVYPPLATFGIYKPSKKKPGSWALYEWFDFDHWPMDANNSLLPNMANGHSHKRVGGNLKQAHALHPDEEQLARRVSIYASTGQFPS